ncbi:MAG: ABC transporter ATP-binding protein [Bdellovibrionaceae bacterium]|nr:ABC transporter ATP-binding protein [Pseudobdellovibrionaceae bacterium]
MNTLMQARGLTKVYDMGEVQVQALRGVDLDLFEGEFIVLLGHSGSGKSTLLNILGGLDRPSEGHLSFQGEAIESLSDQDLTTFRRENIGFIFQMYNLLPRLTARENVELVTEVAMNPMEPQKALEMVGLGNRGEHFPSQMSGGEQQRVAIARAIAKQPKMLFCDEPTGALDVHTGIVVLDAIQKTSESLGTTTVVITHNVTIAGMADRVIHLVDGGISKIESNSKRMRAQELRW